MIDTTNIEEIPYETDLAWSLHLQRRVMRLLLLHDQRMFRGQFCTFFAESTLPKIPLLQQYDHYIKLLTLSDELLDDILPRIRRQLSLQTTQVRLQEEAPTHGDIDWQRTMQRNLSESPGLTPLTFDTHLRERSMAIPENILAVAVLLNYRRVLQNTLHEGLNDEALTDQERQVLVGADERAERELAAPYARALVEEAQRVDTETLADRVATRLRPGASPYRDLIVWWQHFSSLQIGRAQDERSLALASKRTDEKTDAWLYELWIALELAHLLHEAHAIGASDVNVASDTLQFTFTWNSRRFRFIYNRQTELSVSAALGWQHAPASRPDYTIERENLLKVCHEGALIWREPPVILDAKYYLGGSDPTNTHTPIKKLLGDMKLIGAQYGGLFFPRLPEPAPGKHATREVRRGSDLYNREMLGDVSVYLYKLIPAMPLEILQARLRDVLNYASDNLPDRPAPVCEGVWLDPDSINASHRHLPASSVLCPKRHIGESVFDLVDAQHDCLQNPHVCHVIDQKIIPPIVIRATTQDELTQQAGDLRTRNDETLRQAEQSGDEERAEQLRNHIFLGVGRAVEQYVKLRGNTTMIEEHFEQWVFGAYWKQHSRCLAEETRNILLSGEYVWHEYAQAQLEDWAAPVIQYCRALERELKRRSCHHHPSSFKGWTLGSFTYTYANRHTKNDAGHDWSILEPLIKSVGGNAAEFERILQRLIAERVKEYRNQLAHGDPIAKQDAQFLRESILGNRNQPGILYCLAEHLQPV